MNWTDPHTDTTEEVYVTEMWDDGEALVCLVERAPSRSIIVRTTDLMDLTPDRE